MIRLEDELLNKQVTKILVKPKRRGNWTKGNLHKKLKLTKISKIYDETNNLANISVSK